MSTHEPDSRCLSVLVPLYNEVSTLPQVVQKLLKLDEVREIIIVDDCSSDGSDKLARELAQIHASIVFLQLDRHSGKTAALRAGIALTKGEIVIIQDADLEYDPTEIPLVIEPILEGHADVVYGSRFLVRRAARVLYFYHFLANKLLTFLCNSLTNLNMTDIETGYKAFRGEIIRNMVIVSEGFGFEVEATAKVAKLGCAIYEVPISYYGRTYEQGKKIRTNDAIKALWLVLRFNLFWTLRSSFKKMPQLGKTRGGLG